ncbi:MAG: Ribulokinase [uncultured Truepera sp.]|uniref:Ribulokinase n=1 Tax=uncultured Truepera sp. TaxID=543023 RepID=A0A6J4UXU3_9DEIN|nr:MAG: Ribulokinase [uncultured Truepera sp.]
MRKNGAKAASNPRTLASVTENRLIAAFVSVHKRLKKSYTAVQTNHSGRVQVREPSEGDPLATYTIGIDYGTESGRALLVRVSDGAEVATAVHPYGDGVIDRALPDGTRLPNDWALQNPDDYIDVLKHVVAAVLAESGVKPDDVVGVGVDFTACTMLPTLADGTPLCRLGELRGEPHAWVKLWKHHAAQPQADRVNETARAVGETWPPRYGGKISSEWFFSKALQILEEAPEVYRKADRLIEAADWIVWQLTGVETRNACTAGYKAIYQDGDFPPRAFFAALNPNFANVVDEKMSRKLAPLGGKAGGLSDEAARWTGLNPGTAVAVANVDAHVTLPATGVVAPGTFVMIMGTSTCDVLVAETLHEPEGMCGVVKDGIIPGYYGYEAGQSAVGDIFAWFVKHNVPPEYVQKAADAGRDLHSFLASEAAAQRPGEHGLLVLDWFNGNRSVLVDAELSGLTLGMTLSTRAPDLYRALLEATAYSKRLIIETFERSGVPVTKLIAAGGLPAKNPLMMQIYADVCNREIFVIGSEQGPALGSAMHAAVAAGVHADIAEAAAKMGGLSDVVYRPIPENVGVYDQLYADYLYLHDLFGRSTAEEPGGVMKRLRRLREGDGTLTEVPEVEAGVRE